MFFTLTKYGNDGPVVVNTDRINMFRKSSIDLSTVIFFADSEDYICVDESVAEIRSLILGG